LREFSKTENVINRIIDANINRAKEGLRVCEEITRFILNSRVLTADIKGLRHKIDSLIKGLPDKYVLLSQRKSLEDVGRGLFGNELKRNNVEDIFFANIQRVKESLRVLEEFMKLRNSNLSIRFKGIRYDIYEVEKKIAQRIASLYHHR